MPLPKEISIVIYHHGQVANDLIQGSIYSCANPIFLYVSWSIMLAQLIQKINNCFPTRATKTVVQFLYRVPISFHHDQTCFISAQLHDNENLRGVLETIVQNLELNSAEWS